jgi:hypothetical protein
VTSWERASDALSWPPSSRQACAATSTTRPDRVRSAAGRRIALGSLHRPTRAAGAHLREARRFALLKCSSRAERLHSFHAPIKARQPGPGRSAAPTLLGCAYVPARRRRRVRRIRAVCFRAQPGCPHGAPRLHPRGPGCPVRGSRAPFIRSRGSRPGPRQHRSWAGPDAHTVCAHRRHPIHTSTRSACRFALASPSGARRS